MLKISEEKVLEIIKLGKQCQQTERTRRSSVPLGDGSGLYRISDFIEAEKDLIKIPSLAQENYENKLRSLSVSEFEDLVVLFWLGRAGMGSYFPTGDDISSNFTSFLKQAKRDGNLDIDYILDKYPNVVSKNLSRGMFLYSVARRQINEKKAS